MSYKTFVARRYFGSGRMFVAVSTWITTLGITLGMGVICFVMSMHNGFESEIRARLLGTTSHISIFPIHEPFITDYDSVVAKVETVPDVLAASPFIYYKAAISSASGGDGIVVRGVVPDQEKRTANIADDVQVGLYDFAPKAFAEDTIPGIILGSGLADQLSVFIDDPVVLYSLQGEELRKGTRPRVAKFYVAGIFETGMYEYDGNMAYINLTDAQDLFRTGDAATAVHLRLTDIYMADQISPVVDSVLRYNYDVVPWTVLHKNLFSWIAIEKLLLFIGFSLIILVAAFSIISTLVMQTMEKSAEIGILKTMGATPHSIGAIFVYKGLSMGLIGVIAGTLLALAASYAQNQWQLVSLPPDIYFITYLPIDPHLLDFVLAGAITMGICFLASLFPAIQASWVSVVKVLRQ